MGAKKEEYRFTIQFSSSDPRHVQVAGILNCQGRRKAQYLVNAVLCYENKTEESVKGQPPPYDYHIIENIVNQILAEKSTLENKPIKQPSIKQDDKVRKREEINFEDAEMELGQEDLSAIADFITAFRKK